MDETNLWKIINKYFEDNPQSLVRHHIESYNDFFKTGIFQIMRENNPVRIDSRYDKNIDDYRSQCIMYLGGKAGDKVYFGKPVIYDDNDSHYMYPNEARLRNMTYGMTIHYDVEIDFIDILEVGEQPTLIGVKETDEDSDEEPGEKKEQDGGAPPERKKQPRKKKQGLNIAETAFVRESTERTMIAPNTQKRTIVLSKVFLGKFPIMLQSNYCVLSGMPRSMRHSFGECSNDVGGYFIIDGKEKTIVSQEKFGDNMLYIREVNGDDYLYSAEIRSVSENASKPVRTLSVKIATPGTVYTNKNIVVKIPNVRKPVPLFIVFRALGIISDKQIITTCLLDLEQNHSMLDLFVPSVHDAAQFMTQATALEYIKLLTKGKTVAHVLEILSDLFLPHVGETNFIQKAYYLGYVVKRLLSVYTKAEPPTDRDNFKYKRIELVGTLLHELFREYYKIQQRQIQLGFEERLTYNQNIYGDNLHKLINDNYKDVFRERSLEVGVKKAFKGNWGAQTHTKRIGITQELNRLSFNSMLSHLRKTNLPLDASVKVVGPRVLHSTQWGFFDPIDTPDGGNIGLHKHMAISAYVTQGYSREHLIKWLREKVKLRFIEECGPRMLSVLTKVFVNGYWAGALSEPLEAIEKVKLYRRNGLIPIYTSVTMDIPQNTIYMYTDGGRICRPIFYYDEETKQMSFENKDAIKRIQDGEFSWDELVSGFNKKQKGFIVNDNKMYELNELYENLDSEASPTRLKRFIEDKAIIDYIDTNETEGAIIAMNRDSPSDKKYTHHEIHESLIFGMMSNLINFPENNPATRNSFSCGQSKQACSIYHTNFHVRMDKTAVVLNSGQMPLVKTRYLEHINHEGNPYGENTIVAVMCYTGYNVEDAILINEGALNRGLFNTTYYSTYETHEEKSQSGGNTTETLFMNIESETGVVGTKPGYDYSKLDKYGLVRENTPLTDKTVLIGQTVSDSQAPGKRVDQSKVPKKGQLGVVDKAFMTEGESGTRIAKVRVREIRVPNLGDKMASRAGQKGTVGLVIPERDMPFTSQGMRPDIIINPHAIPSRMTIGQFIETVTGKACAMYGGFGDCTAFQNRGTKMGIYGELLTKVGYHSSGNEILYNGMTGEQLNVEIFMGPNYYMRLKHMVKDKINFRARGPLTALTRQPVSGRANDGGLRIGEMERDGVISHGASAFLRESMMERGDNYQMAVCNKTGMIAAYNPDRNIMISPLADGPIKYTGSIHNNDMHIENITKHGRSFSVVNVPYSFKLLIQELQAINVQLRIITDDNIDQIESMGFSNNIHTLLNLNPESSTHRQAANHVKNKLLRENGDVPEIITPAPEFEPKSPDTTTPEGTPPPLPLEEDDTVESSPGFVPGDSAAYDQTSISSQSPGFAPQPVEEDESPPFAPDMETPPTVTTDMFSIGENVYYKNQLWIIRKISPRFITIEAANPTEVEGDLVQIVQPAEIVREAEYSVIPATPPSQEGGNDMMHSLQRQALQHDGGINFAPVINIVNGDSKTEGPTQSQGHNDEMDDNANYVMPGIKGDPASIENKSAPAAAPEKSSSNRGGILDFLTGGLLVKKV